MVSPSVRRVSAPVTSTLFLMPCIAECIYKKHWTPRPASTGSKTAQSTGLPDLGQQPKALNAEDDAKLVFGTIFSLRNMVRKLGGPDDQSVTLAQFALRPVLETDNQYRVKVSSHIEQGSISCITTRLQHRSNSSWSQILEQIISGLCSIRYTSACTLSMWLKILYRLSSTLVGWE